MTQMIKVYIWLPTIEKNESPHHSSLNSVRGFDIGFGHAAVEIDAGSYISKWPKQAKTPYGYTMSYDEDCELCGREADETIEIKRLNEEAMEKYWESVRSKDFNNLLRNCCRVSAKALNHGFFWSNFDSFGFYLKRGIREFIHLDETFIHLAGDTINPITTWHPHTVLGLAKYLQKITD